MARRKAERPEVARRKAERLEAERLEAGRLEAARLEAARLEAARLEAERLEAERLESERLEAARLESERLEAERSASRYNTFDRNALHAELQRLDEEQKRLLQDLDENSLRQTQVNQRLVEEATKAAKAEENAKQTRKSGLTNQALQVAELRKRRAAARTAVINAGTPIDALCASPWCSNPPGPNGRRYCGKKCSDDVARETYAIKKAAAKKTAA